MPPTTAKFGRNCLAKISLVIGRNGQSERDRRMRKLIDSFVQSEDGAITVDWVVLTALILGIQIVVLIATMEDSMVEVSGSIAGEVTEYEEFLD
jgi:hypothetical protein